MPTPEQEQNNNQIPQAEIQTHPETMTLPEKLEQDTGVTAHAHSPQSLTDGELNTPLAQAIPDDTNSVNITLPTTQNSLNTWAKGNPNESKTWLAVFLLRAIQRAQFLGKKVKLLVPK